MSMEELGILITNWFIALFTVLHPQVQNGPLICSFLWELNCTSSLDLQRSSLGRGSALPFHTNSASVYIWLSKCTKGMINHSRFWEPHGPWHLSRSEWWIFYHWQPINTSLNVTTIIFPTILANPCTSNNSDKMFTFSKEAEAGDCDQTPETFCQ